MLCKGCNPLAASALALMFGVALPTISHAQAPKDTVEAVTAPYDRPRSLSFTFPGIIKEVLVKEGDVIKAGQPLMVQDNEIEVAELERLKREAESDARIKYYEADRDLRRKTYERKSNANKGGSAVFSQAEVDEAEADVIKAERQIDVANLDHAGEQTKARQQAVKVDRMTLRSPIDGTVQKLAVNVGEFAEPDRDKPAIIIVKNDPCWVECTELKSWQVARLRVGETMQVKYPGEGESWQAAKIIFIDPVTRLGTDNQMVRLELPNPQNRATGLAIQVKLPAKLMDAAGGRAASGR
jgi:multidrug resistance efflux pump